MLYIYIYIYTHTHGILEKNINKRKERDIYANASNFGITLIALIITIIVLLILAGVTLNMVIGENGIFKKANSASLETNKSQALEELKLLVLEVQSEKNGNANLKDVVNKMNDDNQNEYIVSLSKISKINGNIPNVENAEQIYVLYKNYNFKIDNKLVVYLLDNETVIPESKITSYEELIENLGFSKDTTIEQIVSNENNELKKLLSNEMAVDYIIENPNEYAKSFIDSETALKNMAEDNKIVKKIIANPSWTKKIKESKNASIFENIVDEKAIKIPKLSENNNYIINSKNNSIENTFISFDKNLTGDFDSAYSFGEQYGYTADNKNTAVLYTEYPCYVGYNFEKELTCYKFSFVGICTTNPSCYGITPKKYEIQGSNDGDIWEKIYEGENTTTAFASGFRISDYINTNKRYKMFRMVVNENSGGTSYCNGIIFNELEFYCIE